MKLNVDLLLLLTITVRYSFPNELLQKIPDDPSAACDGVTSRFEERRKAIVGWPFRLDCDTLSQRNVDVSWTRCFVSSIDSSYRLSSELLTLTGHSPIMTSYTVSLVTSSGSCYRKNVIIEKVSSQPCITEVRSFIAGEATNHDEPAHHELVFFNPLKLDCIPGESDVLPPAVDPSQLKTTWRRTRLDRNLTVNLLPAEQCNNYTRLSLRTYQLDQVRNPTQPDSILKYSSNYYDPAVYSCEVEYRGQTAVITHRRVCVKNKIYSSRPLVFCNTLISVRDGDVTKISCDVMTSNARINEGQMKFTWKKEGSSENLCAFVYHPHNNASNNRSINCGINNFRNPEHKCFGYVPTAEELRLYNRDRNTFSIFMEIRNTRIDVHAGKYEVQLSYMNDTSKKQTIRLRPAPRSIK